MTLSERNVRIDVLRGVAVLGVLLIHTQNAWYLAAGNVFVEQGIRLRLRDTWLGMLSAPATLGFLGLNLFFLLSGFCIHLWTLKRQNNAPFWQFSFRAYMKRRLVRLYPAYLAAVVFSLVCLSAADWLAAHVMGMPAASSSVHDVVRQTLSYLTFTHTFSQNTFSGYNPPLYTMAIEIHFYVLYPIVLWAFRRWGGLPTLVASLAVSGAATYLALQSDEIGGARLIMDSVLVRWPEWILGCVLAQHWYGGKSIWLFSMPTQTLVKMSLCCLFVALAVQVFQHVQLNVLWSFGLAGIIVIYLNPSARMVSPLEKALGRLGMFSYSIYLVHYPLLKLGSILLLPDPSRLLFHLGIYCVALPLIVLIAYVFFQLFEKPTMTRASLAAPSALSAA
jgi:peptidoglycan/LPS O-acetylase OafA/YrhL